MSAKRISGAVLAIGFAALNWLGCGESSALTAEQKQGKKIYEALCDKCHQLKNPKVLSDAEWPTAVIRYGDKLKLTESELAAITAYLQRANDADY